MVNFVTECWRKDVIFVVCGISVLALHLPLQLLRAEEYLEHKVILKFPESIDVLLSLNVLLGDADAL